MTEKEIRAKVVNTAVAWLGCKESDGSHKKIIDVYNGHTPRARGYKVTYTDAWCATFVSAVAIKAGYTDIIPLECGCNQFITLAKTLGIIQGVRIISVLWYLYLDPLLRLSRAI